MRRFSFGLAAAVGALGIAFVLAPSVRGQGTSRLERQTLNGRDVVAREGLVKFKEGLEPPDLSAIAADTDLQAVSALGRRGALHSVSKPSLKG